MNLQTFCDKAINKVNKLDVTTIVLIEVVMKVLMDVLENCQDEHALKEIKNPRLINKLRLRRKLKQSGCVMCDSVVESLLVNSQELTDDELLGLIREAKSDEFERE